MGVSCFELVAVEMASPTSGQHVGEGRVGGCRKIGGNVLRRCTKHSTLLEKFVRYSGTRIATEKYEHVQ